MAAKSYWVWNDKREQWEVDWGYAGQVLTRGARSHEVHKGYSGKFYTFTYGARPKNNPPTAKAAAPSKLTKLERKNIRAELTETNVKFGAKNAIWAAQCLDTGRTDYSGADFVTWVNRVLGTPDAERSRSWSKLVEGLTDDELIKLRWAKRAEVTARNTPARVWFAAPLGAWIGADQVQDGKTIDASGVEDDQVLEVTKPSAALRYHLVRTRNIDAHHADKNGEKRIVHKTVTLDRNNNIITTPEEAPVPSTPKVKFKYSYGRKSYCPEPHVSSEDALWGDDKLVAAIRGVIEAYEAKFGHKVTDVVIESAGHKVQVAANPDPTPEERRLAQHRDMMSRFTRVGFGAREARHALSSAVLGRKVTTNAVKALTDGEREQIIAKLTELERGW